MLERPGSRFGRSYFKSMAGERARRQRRRRVNLDMEPLEHRRLLATRIWDGGGVDALWTTAENWDTDTAPLEGDDLVFPADASQFTNENDFAANTNFAGITIEASGYNLTGNAIDLDGVIAATYNAGSSIITTDIRITDDIAIDVATGGTLDMANAISPDDFQGGYQVTKAGGGTLRYSGSSANTYNSGTLINAGTLVLVKADDVISSNGYVVVGDNAAAASLVTEGDNQFWVGSTVTVNEGSNFDVGATDQDISVLTLQGASVTIDSGGTLLLFSSLESLATANDAVSTITGEGSLGQSGSQLFMFVEDDDSLDVELSIGVVMTGDKPIHKQSAGTLALSVENTYTGATNVDAGTLLVNGSVASSSGVTVADGATLGGSGTVPEVTIDSGGTVAPGTSAGILSASFISLASGSTFRVDLNGSTVGTGYDRLAITDGSALFDPNGATLDVSLGYLPSVNESFQIVSQSAATPITGRFNGLSQFGSFTEGPVTFSIGYFNSGITLTVTNVAPPTFTWDGGDTDDSLWSSPDNWVGDVAPTAGANLVFADGADRLSNFNDFASDTAFNSITIAGAGYSLNGNAIQLEEGITTTYASGTSTIGLDVGLTADQTFEVASGGTLSISGALSGGAVGLTKAGGGTLTLTSNANGSLTGGVTVSEGTLTLGIVGSLPSGTVTLAGGATLSISSTTTIANPVELTGDPTIEIQGGGATFTGALSGGAHVLTKTGDGALLLSNTSNEAGLTGGVVVEEGTLGAYFSDDSLPAGTVTLADGTTLYVNGSFTIDNDVTLTGDATIENFQDFELSGLLSGSATLTKAGGGTLTLTNTGNEANFTGGIDVDAGTLSVEVDENLPAGTVTLAAGTTLLVLEHDELDIAIDNDVTLTGDATIQADEDTELSGLLSGSATLTKAGSEDLVLLNTGNEAAFTGGIIVSEGRLSVADDDALPAGTITLNEGTTLEVVGATTIDNDVTLDGDATINAAVNITLSGLLSGSGTLTKNSGGTLTLTNTGNEAAFSGGIRANQGTLSVADDDALGSGTVEFRGGFFSITGNTDIDNDLLLNSSATPINVVTGVTATISGVIGETGGSRAINKSGSGTLVLAGTNTFSGNVNLNGGTIQVASDANLGSGTVRFNQGGTLEVTGSGTIDNAFFLNVPGTISNSGALTLSGVIDGHSNLTKVGTGTLTLTGTNTYTGTTNVNAGTLELSGGSAIADASAVTVASGATLRLQADEAIGTLAGFGDVELGASTLTVGGEDATSFGGTISGTGGLTQAGLATLTLTGSNTYTGATNVLSGALTLSGGSAIADASAVTVASGTYLHVLDSETIGSLAGDGFVTLGNTLLVGDNDADTTFSGSISGSAGLTKVGEGTLTLDGSSSYTGATIIDGGKLVVHGYLGDSSGLLVNDGGTLGGLGLVPDLVVAGGGTVAPGNSPQALTSGAVSFAGGSTFDVELDGLIPGIEYDQLIANGSVDLGGATLALTIDGGFTPTIGTVFTILENNGLGPITGTFAGLAEGAQITIGATTFGISYVDGDGNDVTLTAVASTTTTVASSADPSIFGDDVTFTVTVGSGDGTPTGSVTLVIDGIAIETMELDGSGVATFVVSGLAPGSHSVTADYIGLDGYLPSSGELAGGHQVGQAPTSTTVLPSVNPSVFGQGVTFTAVVVGLGVGTPTGLVEFFDDGASLGTVELVNGSASITFAGLATGGHAITAAYLGDLISQASTSAVVVQGVNHAEVSLAVTPGSAGSVVGQAVRFDIEASAVAPGAGTPGGRVQVLIDGSPAEVVELDANGRGSVALTFDGAGTFAVAFRYLGDANFSAGDAPVVASAVVEPAATKTTFSASSGSLVVGRAVTFTASVAPTAPGVGTPGGLVTFLDGETVLGTAMLVDGVATLTVPGLAYGGHSILAVYAGSSDFGGSASADLAFEVSVTQGDYDGDGIADLATYEYIPELNSGRFDILLSGGGTLSALLGDEGSIPVAGDFDGDGKADMAVFSPNGGAATWTILRSGDGERQEVTFGAAGLLDLPAPADYDGDGITDIATFRANSDLVPGAAQWFILPSDGDGAYSVLFGAAGGADVPAPADYDGDGKADIATYRRDSDLVPGAAQWFILPSDPENAAYSVLFGAGGGADVPVPADYDGDGKADIATYRSNGDLSADSAQWFILNSSAPGTATMANLGRPGSIGAPGVYHAGGIADLAAFDRLLAGWRIRPLDATDAEEITFGPRGSRVVPVLASLADRLEAVGDDDEDSEDEAEMSILDEALAGLGSEG